MRKMLVFDMDGTIANLYGVENWLPMLRAEDTTPYEVAEPMFDETVLLLLDIVRDMGWTIAVTTWGAMNASKEYNKAVMAVKREWLINQRFPFDEFHGVKYGTTKANCTRGKADFQVLIDDNEGIRNGWTLGKAVDPSELVKTLVEIITGEIVAG